MIVDNNNYFTIKGKFFKYKYNDTKFNVETIIFCRNVIDFEKLITVWNLECRRIKCDYTYTYQSFNCINASISTIKDIYLEYSKNNKLLKYMFNNNLEYLQ